MKWGNKKNQQEYNRRKNEGVSDHRKKVLGKKWEGSHLMKDGTHQREGKHEDCVGKGEGNQTLLARGLKADLQKKGSMARALLGKRAQKTWKRVEKSGTRRA